MSQNQLGHGFDPIMAMKKLIISAFVIGSFVLYVAYDRHINAGDIPVEAPTEVALLNDPSTTPSATFLVPTPTAPPDPTLTASVPPTNTRAAEVEEQAADNVLPNVSPISPTPSDVPPTNTPVFPTDTPIPPTDVPTIRASSTGKYRDGLYKGDVADAFYGTVQVQVRITAGKIAVVQFLDYPHDRRTSQYINSQAMPYLKTEAIRAQSASVDIISGATLTSQAFIQSLQSALSRARG